MSLDLLYTYKASVVLIRDGDTVVLDVHLGFGVVIEKQGFRLSGINAEDLRSKDAEKRALAVSAKERVMELLADGTVIIRSFKPLKTEKWGRWLAEITNSAGVNVNQTLLDEGLAVVYNGGKRQ